MRARVPSALFPTEDAPARMSVGSDAASLLTEGTPRLEHTSTVSLVQLLTPVFEEVKYDPSTLC